MQFALINLTTNPADVQYLPRSYQSLGMDRNAVEATEEIIFLMPRIISLRKDLQTRVTMEVVTKPEVLQLPPLTSPWTALHNIVSSPWFDRLWILQEAALAGDISFLCGRHVIEWKVLWNIMDMSILLTQLATVSDTVRFD
jgi:hypothetical protein